MDRNATLNPLSIRRLFGFKLPTLGASFKSAAWLFSGTAASQLVSLLFAPVLTRIYEPHEMGLYSIFLSTVGIVAVVAALRFDLAIPVARTDEEAAGLRKLAMGSLMVISVLAAVVLLVVGQTTIRTSPNWSPWFIPLLPAAVLAGGCLQIGIFSATRQKKFREISQARFVGVFATGFTQIITGAANHGAVGLFGGVVLGSVAGWSVIGTRLAKARSAAIETTKTSLRAVASTYKNYPLYSIWGALLNSFSIHVPVFIISAKFGTDITGQYGLSSRFLFAPLALVASAVSQVFLANAAAAQAAGTLGRQVERIFTVLNGFAIILLLPAGIVAPELFQMVFGGKWTQAGHFALLLTPWLVLVLTGAPLSNVTLVLHRQRAELVFQIVLFTARVGSLWIGAKYFDAERAIMLFAVASAVAWLAYHVWVFQLVKLPVLLIARGFLKSALFALPIIALAWILKAPLASSEGILRVALAASIPLCAGIVFLLYARTSAAFNL